jgi:cell division transport system permease protein
MIARYFERALEDIVANRFVNGVTLLTISLAVIMVSTTVLFFVNTGDMLDAWQQGTRIMAYLRPGTAGDSQALEQTIQAMDGVQKVRFIPRDDALEYLKNQMPQQSSLFENLDENPLPDAFEIQLKPTAEGWKNIESIAARISALNEIDDVEYGRKWVDTIQSIVQLFRTTGMVIIGLFFLVAVAIVANTTRLVIYSRREELEILRLVGAAEGFIKTPFYIQGLIQGLAGAAAGLGVLFGIFSGLASRLDQSAWAGVISIRFLSPHQLAAIVLGSMLVGWLGCYLSLRHSLRS